jgi:hypothetical protein
MQAPPRAHAQGDLHVPISALVLADMIGLPLLVGIVLWRMDRAGAHSDADYVQSFGWIYGACEAHVFYYGWFSILRRTAFVLIGKLLDNPLAQSTCATVLLAAIWLFHVKLEPYKGTSAPVDHE